MSTDPKSPQAGDEPVEVDHVSSATSAEDTAADEHVMGLLSEHVPLSLIVDLSDPDGPHSQEILDEEGEPDDAWWGVEGDGAAAEAGDDTYVKDEDAPSRD